MYREPDAFHAAHPLAGTLAAAVAGTGGNEGHDDGGGQLRVNTLWISDLHLGTRECKARQIQHLLKTVECQTLYLVGDIIDGWQLRKRWYWPQSHNDVVQKVLRKARKGTRVVFVCGNHDEFARQFVGLNFGGIEVVDQAMHATADGKRLWIIHGDHLDAVIQHAKWLARLGDELYILALKINHLFNVLRLKFGLPYWSLSLFLKQKVKNAVAYIDSFERALALEARGKHCDGVVCGHIHKAEIRDIGGVRYVNCGDWVESCTAIVENAAGELRLIQLHDLPSEGGAGERQAAAAVGPALEPAAARPV